MGIVWRKGRHSTKAGRMIVDILISVLVAVGIGGVALTMWALCKAAHNADEAIQREEARRNERGK